MKQNRTFRSFVAFFAAVFLASFSVSADDAFSGKQGDITRSALKLYGGFVNSFRVGSNGNLIAGFGSASGIFCSSNGGTSWIAPPAGSDFGMISDTAFGDNPQTVYIIAGTGLLKSTDFCGSWSELEGNNYDQTMLYANGTLLVAVRDGIVAHSTDGGASITNTTVGSGLGRVRGIGASATPGTFFVLIYTSSSSSTTALYKSTDGGSTWSPMGKTGSYMGIFGHPTDPNTLMILGNGGGEISTNGGSSWEDLGLSGLSNTNGSWSGNRLYVGAGYRIDGETTWHGFNDVEGMAADSEITGWITADPVTPNLLYAASARGVSKSTDNGLVWHDVVEGIYAVTVHDIFQATDKDTVYLAVTGGLAKTTNFTDAANITWTHLRIGASGSTAWSVFARKADPSRILVASANRIYHSEDSGATWNEASTPLENGFDVYDFEELPDGRIVGAAHDRDTCNGGVIVSSDNGLTWTSLSTGGYTGPSNAFTVLGQNLYVAVGAENSSLPCTEQQSGVFKFDTTTSTWTQLEGLKGKFANDIITAGSTLFVSVGERFGTSDSGVYRSKDGGATWETMKLEFAEGDSAFFKSLAVDGTDPNIVYAASGRPNGNGTIFRSPDGGDTWVSYYRTLRDEVPEAIFVDDLLAGFNTGLFGLSGNVTAPTPTPAPYKLSIKVTTRTKTLTCTLKKNGRAVKKAKIKVMLRTKKKGSFRRVKTIKTDSKGKMTYRPLRRRSYYRCDYTEPSGHVLHSSVKRTR